MKNPALHTYFLAQIMGLYLVIVPVIILHRREMYRSILKSMDKPNLTIIMGSTVGLILGLILVDVHNIWVMKPHVVVTIVARAVLLKSILWLSMPERMIAYCKKAAKSSLFYVELGLMCLLCIYLLANGFFLFTPPVFPFN